MMEMIDRYAGSVAFGLMGGVALHETARRLVTWIFLNYELSPMVYLHPDVDGMADPLYPGNHGGPGVYSDWLLAEGVQGTRR